VGADDRHEHGVDELLRHRVAPDVHHVQRLEDGRQADVFQLEILVVVGYFLIFIRTFLSVLVAFLSNIFRLP
jgi:hypothetical protein